MGGEIGSGTMDVFWDVVDPESVLPVILKAIAGSGLLEAAAIAVSSDEERKGPLAETL